MFLELKVLIKFEHMKMNFIGTVDVEVSLVCMHHFIQITTSSNIFLVKHYNEETFQVENCNKSLTPNGSGPFQGEPP